MARLLKLNLGCGEKYWPGFKNHDLEVDLKALPYESDSVDEIHLIHVFEHLPRVEVNVYIDEWRRVLKKGGLLVLEMPSLTKIAQLITQGVTNHQLTLAGIFGDITHQNPYMKHQWCWAEWELLKVMDGFECEFKTPVFHVPKRDLRLEARKK